VKKYTFLMLFLIVPLFSFDNHFFGLTVTTGTISGDGETVLQDEDFLSFGAKTGIITDNIITYADFVHVQFKDDTVTKINPLERDFNDDYLSFIIGPMFQLDLYVDTYIYLAGVVSVDKFHYSKKISEYKNQYISKYQLFFGYEFGLIFPIILNPFDDVSDSFLDIGYRHSYANRSLDNNDENDMKDPFDEIGYYFFGVNFLF
jgi:hypothetical protein